MRRAPARAFALGVAVAVAGILALPSVAAAHATLESSTPQRGAVAARGLEQVAFAFDEAVEGSFGAVRVFDSRGRRVDRGGAFHPDGRGAAIAVRLAPGLPDGAYTATYRLVSADGHVVTGGVVFSIGRASVGGRTVAELISRSGSGPVTATAFAVARAVQDAAIAVAAGALAFLLVAFAPALRGLGASRGERAAAGSALTRRLRDVVLVAAGLGAASALAGVTLEAAQAAGVGAWSALRPDVAREVLDTRFGSTWSIAAGCWLTVGVLAVRALGREAPPGDAGRSWYGVLLAAPLLYLLCLPALSGHGSTQDPVALVFGANVVHVAAAATWLGGLVCVLAALPAATRRLAAPLRTRLLVAVLARFSTVALGAVAALALTGIAQAIVEVGRFDALASTAFGRAVAIKALLLIALVGLGALNRRRTLPRLRAAADAARSPGAAGLALRRTLRGEIALIALALAVTGALTGYPPSATSGAEPFSRTGRIGGEQLQVTLDPARVGANQLHLYLTDPRTGAPATSAKEVRVSASLPQRGIGPLKEHASRAGPGHYVVPALALAVAGRWRLEIAVRVSDFDEHAQRIEVPIR